MKRPKRMHLAFLVAMAVALSLPGILLAQNGGMMGGVLVDEEDQLLKLQACLSTLPVEKAWLFGSYY